MTNSKIKTRESYRPFVTVILPTFNEEDYIEKCLDSIVSSSYPKDRLEVIVVDGLSEDRTRPIVEDYATRFSYFHLIDNPFRLKPIALNLGIRESNGDILIRMDGHATYGRQYIEKCVYHLVMNQEASSVGGIRRTLPGGNTVIARAIAHAISHPFAVGNATYRTGSEELRWVDILFGFCCRREVFEELGLFNESLIRGQDREFNFRIQKAGGKLLLAPDVISEYYARSRLIDYTKWVYDGGMTPFYISRITERLLTSWRNWIPLFFVFVLLVLPISSFMIHQMLWFFFLVVGVYLLTASAFAAQLAFRGREFSLFPTMILIFFVTHFFYGIGSFVGLIKPVTRNTEISNLPKRQSKDPSDS